MEYLAGFCSRCGHPLFMRKGMATVNQCSKCNSTLPFLVGEGTVQTWHWVIILYKDFCPIVKVRGHRLVIKAAMNLAGYRKIRQDGKPWVH